MKQVFSAESVTEGHPDKLCDQVSDAVLDAYLREDPESRVACETTACTGLVHLMGEITSTAQVDVVDITRQVICEIGYNRPELGFDGYSCPVISSLTHQSADIAMGVDHALEVRRGALDILEETGAGDQGMVYGYACRETEEFMPLPIELAHRLTRRMADVRKSGRLPCLRPDGKSLVSVEYDNGKPRAIKAVVLAAQHDPEIEPEELQAALLREVVAAALPQDMLRNDTVYIINGTGRFVIGGPVGDSGLTGRKIIVDTYGGAARHGGGAFSGKDPTKVDRSAAYAARWIAKNVVASGLSERCEVQIAYAIGVSHPVSVLINDFDTARIPRKELVRVVNNVFDLRPAAIIRDLDLRRPIYRQTASYGHFGRTDLDLPWEKLNRVKDLLSAAKV